MEGISHPVASFLSLTVIVNSQLSHMLSDSLFDLWSNIQIRHIDQVVITYTHSGTLLQWSEHLRGDIATPPYISHTGIIVVNDFSPTLPQYGIHQELDLD